LRYKEKYHRMWRSRETLAGVPSGGKDFPLGITLNVLFCSQQRFVHLFTEVATIYGVSFTLRLVCISRSRQRSGQAGTLTGRGTGEVQSRVVDEETSIRFASVCSRRRKKWRDRDPNNLTHRIAIWPSATCGNNRAHGAAPKKDLASSDGRTKF